MTRKNREMEKGRELFVTRLNPVGTAAVYSASLAGDSDEQSFAIAVAGQAGLGDGIYIFNESYHCKRFQPKYSKPRPTYVSIYDALLAKINEFPIQ